MKLLHTPEIDPQLAAAVARYRAAGTAQNTVRAYGSIWRGFEAWCRAHGVLAMPALPMTCAAYLADRAGALKASSLGVHLAAIHHVHVRHGAPSPCRSNEVLGVMRGIRRELGIAPHKKAALTPEQLAAVIMGLGTGLLAQRDRALLLLGFCGGFRRSELVALDVGDVIFRDAGVLVVLRRSKTDQERLGRIVAVDHGAHAGTCPGAALRAWLVAADLRQGPLFRPIHRHGQVLAGRLQGRAVARVLQGRAAAVGLDTRNLSGHSLRSGFVTAAARAQLEERQIASRTGHHDFRVLRGYVQQADPFEVQVTRRLGF